MISFRLLHQYLLSATGTGGSTRHRPFCEMVAIWPGKYAESCVIEFHHPVSFREQQVGILPELGQPDCRKYIRHIHLKTGIYNIVLPPPLSAL